MKESILDVILQAEYEYEKIAAGINEKSQAYFSAAENKRRHQLKSIQQQRQLFEETTNQSFQQRYADSEAALIAHVQDQKERLKASKEKRIAEISKQIKNDILEDLFSYNP